MTYFITTNKIITTAQQTIAQRIRHRQQEQDRRAAHPFLNEHFKQKYVGLLNVEGLTSAT